MNAYKTIVVHLDRDERQDERLKVTFALATRFDAHVVGLFAPREIRVPEYAMAEAGDALLEAQERFRAEAARRAMESFHASAARHPGVTREWRNFGEDALGTLCTSARYADIVVVGQHDPDSDASLVPAAGFVDDLVLSAGRPVLIVPYAGRFPSLGKNVLVAWNASPEAARAVSDALPLLTQAENVHVMAFNPAPSRTGHGESPGADVALHLARHGVSVTAVRQDGVEGGLGELILSRAADLSADLIVMGAYGHSRLRERIVGGVTRTLLESMTVPVLMSH